MAQTRLCLDPWAKILIKSNREVCICCYSPKIGHLNEETLNEILDGEKATAYREGLISGEMQPACKRCPDKNMVDLEILHKAVRKYLETSEKPYGIG